MQTVALMDAQNATEDQLNLMVNIPPSMHTSTSISPSFQPIYIFTSLQVSECVASLMRATKEAFTPTFKVIEPELVRMLAPTSTLESKRIALFIFDDYVEYDILLLLVTPRLDKHFFAQNETRTNTVHLQTRFPATPVKEACPRTS